MLTLDRVYKAKRVLSEVVRQTDMIRAKNISSQCDVYLKTENLQVTGSFKVRGSYFKISQLSDEEKKKGVIACSAGNHAQGVALAATKNGIKSLICLPDGAPISKVEATKRYGADVCLVKGVYDDAYNKAIELQKEKGYTFIHPFNDPDVIAGQGTIGLEILEQLPDVDVVVVPIGGGGLIAGVAYTIKQINPNCKVYGVQAAGAPSMKNSVADGKIETLKNVQTIADGIAVKTPGTNTFELIKKYVDGIYTVSDDEIALAILTLMEQQKLVSEGLSEGKTHAQPQGKRQRRVGTRGPQIGFREIIGDFRLEIKPDKPAQIVLRARGAQHGPLHARLVHRPRTEFCGDALLDHTAGCLALMPVR